MEYSRLYRRLLGPAWDELDRAVQLAHRTDGPAQFIGQSELRPGRGRIARWALALARLPTRQASLPVRLSVVATDDREIWSRRFGDHELSSWQTYSPDGYLLERMGCLEFRFSLAVREGALFYEQRGARFRWKFFSFPLPRFLAPRAEGVEQASSGERTHVSVKIRAPLIGELLAYEAYIKYERETA